MPFAFSVRWLRVSTLLALLTIATTLTVAYLVNGSVMATVNLADLRRFGGTTFEDIGHFELWRLVAAQLIHAKMAHMLLNAAGLFLLGNAIEPVIGGMRVLLLWLVAGGIATWISPLLIEAPWNVGTGASQATFAFAGCAAFLAVTGRVPPLLSWILVAFVLLPGVTLDFTSGGYPKPGHVSGLLIGGLMGLIYGRALRASRRSEW